MAVELRCETARGRRYARLLQSDARALMRMLKLERGELSLMLVDDRTMRSLNRRFRNHDRPTDVLSFPQLEDGGGAARTARRASAAMARTIARPAGPGSLLGDIVISLDTALAQARRAGIAPAGRLRALLVHGLLHLLGYDHERSAAEARRMFSRERRLAAKLPAAKSRSRRR